MTAGLGPLLALWSHLAGLGPRDATVLAARVEGLQRFEGEALAILASESRGERVGVHRPHHGRVRGCVFWRAAVDAGWLHLGECEHHTPGDNYCERWGIRGAHGNAAAYAVRHLGGCVAPEALDVPYLSAVVTVRRLWELERRYGKRTAEAREKAWRVGVGG